MNDNYRKTARMRELVQPGKRLIIELVDSALAVVQRANLFQRIDNDQARIWIPLAPLGELD